MSAYARSFQVETIETGIQGYGSKADQQVLTPAPAAKTNLRSKSRRLKTIQREAFTGLGVVQMAICTLEDVYEKLERGREMAKNATRGMDDTLDPRYRVLLLEVDQLNDTTCFNDTRLFGGGGFKTAFATGMEPGDEIVMETQPFNMFGLGLENTDLMTTISAVAAMSQIDRALRTVGSRIENLRQVSQDLESAINLMSDEIEAMRDAIHESESMAHTDAAQENGQGMEHGSLNIEKLFEILGS